MKAHRKSRGNRTSESRKTANRLRALVEAMEPRVFLSASPALIDLADLSSAIGSNPYGNLVMSSSGNLYGLAESGGANSDGSVFEIPAGSTSATTIASFNGTNGRFPEGGLIFDSSGNLYGTASSGTGTGHSKGNVFEIATGTSSITVIAYFNGTDGQGPDAGLTMDASGDLFGTAGAGGANSHGAVFEIAAGSSTITNLASFNGTDGATPEGNVILDSSGDLYGTAVFDGADNSGALFEVAADSTTITTLASFTGTPNGAWPKGNLVMDSSGDLYGAAANSGANGNGAIFELAAGSNSITTLVSFNGSNGSIPDGGVIMDTSGNLFGTTSSEGVNDDGTVFEVAAGSNSITTLATFNGTDGRSPLDSLIMDTSGNLYGTAESGGANSEGDVFEVTIPPAQAVITSQPTTVTAGTSQSISVSLESGTGIVQTTNQSTVTLSIASGPAGATLGGTLTASAVNGVANFTGLTYTTAGTYTLTASSPYTASAVTSTITVSAATASQVVFTQQPASATSTRVLSPILVDVEDAYGNLVTTDTSTVALSSGTTLSGTTSTAAVGGIATFSGVWIDATGSFTLTASDASLTPATSSSIAVYSESWTLSSLASFSPSTGATSVSGPIIDSNGNLYGTVDQGPNNDGGVYEIAAGTTTIAAITFFNGTNGQTPVGGLIMDSSGNLYGTTSLGGSSSEGTVFEIAAGTTTITSLASLGGTYGNSPEATVVMDSSGNLYGTTDAGGANGDGTVFEVAAGTHTLSKLADFATPGGSYGSITVDSSGDLFGTLRDNGGVFEIPAGTTTLDEIAAFNFTIGPQYGALAMDSSGDLYGMTEGGGADADGEVFEVAATSHSLTTVASFNGANGNAPAGGLIMDSQGDLFGSASGGGANGDGTLWEILPGATTITTLASLNSADGFSPEDDKLAMDSSGNLYGTGAGGANNYGAVFKLALDTTEAVVTSQPTTVPAGTSLSVTLSLETVGSGAVETSNNSTVTLSIASGPSGATLGGTLTATAVNGVATFSGLTLDTAGAYTLAGSSSGPTASAPSATITITPLAAVKLGVAQQPTSAVPDHTFAAIAVNVEDMYGNIVTSDTSTVTLSTTTTLIGTASVPAVGGVATFSSLYVAATGTYTLSASDGSLTSATLNSITVSPPGYTLTDLANFNSSTGIHPYAGLIADSSGNLYGTTDQGKTTNDGAVFEIAAGSSAISDLALFNSATGKNPADSLVIDSSGDLYGTTQSGGTSNDGIVFEVAAGKTTITRIASFNSSTGYDSTAGLVMDSSGDLHGTTLYGGANSDGTVFEIVSGSNTITPIASFNSSTGYHPAAGLIMDSSGNLYGTTFYGGANSDGSVFELASGSSAITNLASFSTNTGTDPESNLIMDSYGNLYGTTPTGGANGDGTLFELASGSSTITPLASFNSTTGYDSVAGLVMNSAGNLYGTAEDGGANSYGTVFEYSAGTINVLASLTSSAGEYPLGSLLLTSSGALYGTAESGGSSSDGTVFEVVPPTTTQAAITAQPTTVTAGSPQSVSVSLESYSSTVDTTNQSPVTLSIASGPTGASIGGTLTVTAVNGVADFTGLTFTTAGTYTLTSSSTGVPSAVTSTITVNASTVSQLVFAQQPADESAYHTLATVLVDVEDAYGNLVTTDTSMVTLSSSTTLSGTTSVAAIGGVATFNDVWIAAPGTYTLSAGDGSLTTAPSSSITVSPPGYGLTEVVDFGAASSDLNPVGNLIADSSGDLFGAADMGGGIDGDGAVFEIPAGTSTVVNLAVFDDTTGENPAAGVVMDSNGNLFGTTLLGGNDNDGTVYEVAAGSSSITTLVLFNQTTGYVSDATLLMDSSGNLFGTTYYGGAYNDGTVFEIAAGTTSLTVIASFNQGTGYLSEGLIMDSSGNLYGAASSGGANNDGTVFEIAAGSSAITDLANFTTSSGTDPACTLVMDSNGNLYGTDIDGGANGDGTVFELASGSNTITPLASFNSATGYSALAGLIMDSDGHLFGTTEYGGANGEGTIFEYSAGTIAVLGSLSSAVGSYPDGGLLGSAGNLYGAADLGGTGNSGTVFEATPSSSTQTAIISQPTTVTAGTSQSISVDLESLDGTLDTTNQSPVTLTLASGPTGATIGGTLTVSAVNGVADFTGLTFDTAGAYTLTARSPGLASAASSTITVNAATASQLVVVQQPTSAVAGQSIGTVAVDIEDPFGNIITTDTAMVALSSSTTIGGTTSAAAIGGVATFSGLTVDTAGPHTLTAASTGLASATSSSFTITHAGAAQLAISQQPTTAYSYHTMGSILVSVEDTYGNVVTSSAATITLSGATTLSGTTSVAAVAGVATFSNLWIDATGSFTVTAASGGLTSATSGSVAVASAASSITDLVPLNSTTGDNPYAGLIMDTSGNLYGTASAGGIGNGGTAFEVAAANHAVTVLENGGYVIGGLLMDSSGDVFGATNHGTTGYGSIFEIPVGTTTANTLANFNSTIGGSPENFMIMDSSGNLFGTTYNGGTYNDGTVFELSHGSSTITRLASFNGTNGVYLYSGVVMDSSGNIYGTTFLGGPTNQGTIWELPAGSSSLTALATFNGTNGANPYYTNIIIDSSGDLYATTNSGGAYGDGTVFELPSGSSTITTVVSFNGTNGSSPEGVVMDSSGNLYGTTAAGGADNDGTIFAIAAGSGAITAVASFNGTNGQTPEDRLLLDSSGNMYGTAYQGGANSDGTVFEANALTGSAVIAAQPTTITAGTSQSITVDLNTTSGSLDTTNQSAVTLSILSGPSGATLSGTTTVSAVNGVASFTGLSLTKAGTYTLAASSAGVLSGATNTITVGAADAAQVAFTTQPTNTMSGQSIAAVAVSVEDTFGNVVTTDTSTVTLSSSTTLHGTTSVAAVNGVATFTGLSINPLGNFTLSASDAGFTATSNSFTISALTTTITGLNRFNSTTGYTPSGNIVMDSSGNLFGTAENGGANNQGTVWEVPAGTTSITPIASFNGTNGANPYGGVIMDSSGDLFGTTLNGGAHGVGSVFEIHAGTTSITTLASFNGTNGSNPYDTLFIDSSGNLFGTTYNGGANSDGTVFEIAAGSGTITSVASFNGTNGKNPRGGLVMDTSGDLFGTTQIGGSSNDGTVFEIASGTSAVGVLVNFNGANGANPEASLIIDSSGNLYGTTFTSNSWADVFKIAAGTSTLTTVAALPQYANVNTSLIMDSNGDLFGTAWMGGVNSDGSSTLGAIYEVVAGATSATILASFAVTPDGKLPLTDAVLDPSGNLFTTSSTDDTTDTGALVEVAALPAASQVVLTSQPTNAVAGASQTFAASIETSSGVVLASLSTITLSIASGPNGGTLGGTLGVTGTNGVATFSGIIFNKPGTYVLSASAGLLSATSNNITVTVGAANKTVFAQAPSTTTAGQNIGTVIADITDSVGNLITSSTALVTLSGTGLSGTTSVAAVGGVATFNNLTMTTAGSITLTAASSGLNSGTSNAITVNPTTANKLVFTSQPTSTSSGQSLGMVAVSVEDAYGNVVTTDSSTVSLVTSDGSPLAGTTSAQAVNGVAVFAGLSIAPLGTRTLEASDGSLTSATSSSFTISALAYALIDLASFNGSTGNTPYATPVLDSSGDLFGTTDLGGTNNLGTVWELAAGSSTVTTIASFNSSTGGNPQSALVMDSSGDVFGTTTSGGANSDGTVFEVAAASSTITRLVSFTTQIKGWSELSLDSDGNVYGTTQNGGTNGDGTVFEIAAGSTAMTTLASFPTATGNPFRGVVVDSAGDLFGVTHSGGSGGTGVVYELPAGSSSITVLANFSGYDTGDSNPPLIDSNGNLYLVGYNNLSELPAGSSTITLLAASNGGVNLDGGVWDAQGNFFGTEFDGGAFGHGTVYEIPAGSSTYITLATFNGTNGANTYSSTLGNVFPDVTEDSQGNLYGTAPAGGADNLGAVYEVATPPAATQAVIISQPTTVTAGSSQSLSVSLESAGGLVLADSSTISLSIASGPDGATLGGTLTATDINGVATFSGLTFDTAGTYTLTASSSGVTSAVTTTITVNATTASQLIFAQQPASANAGQSIGTVAVDVEDAYGNLVTTNTSTVSLSTSTALSGTQSVAAVGGVATFTGLSIDLAGTYTLSAAAGGLASASSNSFTITPATASNLVFDEQPSGATAGQTIGTITVNVEDDYGNIVTTDDSTVALSTGAAIFGTDSVQAVSGVATFTGLSIESAGGYMLSATDTGLTSATSNSITITPAAAAQLAFDEQPVAAAAGDSIGTVTVDVQDQYGNLVTGDTSSVSVSSSATINGTTSVSAVGGVATFTGLSIDLAADDYTLSATDGSLTSATSSSFNITPAAAAALVFNQQPGSAAAGQSIGAVTVDVEDQYGNLVTNETSSVSVSSSTTLNGTASVSTVGGVATFTGLSINLAADGYTLSATDGGLPSAISNSFDITPATAAMLVFDQQPGSAAAGQSIGTVIVDVEDQYGNLVTGDTSSVSLSSSTSINGTTSVSAIGGVATFTGLSINLAADGYTLSAADGGLTSATSSSFNITPGGAAMLAFDQQPGSASAGQTIGTVTVDVVDQYGNLVSNDTSSVSVSSGAAINGTTSVSAVGGVATFTGLSIDLAANGYTLSATDGGLTSATSSSFNITPAAAAVLVFDQQPTSAAAGQSIGTVTVDVEDQYGNVVTGDTSSVTLSSSTTLSGTASVSAVAGVATFTGLSIDLAADGYTVSATDGSLTSATSNSFDITPATAAKLVFGEQPTTAVAGQSIGTVTVDVEDQYGNLVSGDTSSVSLSSSTTINGTTSVSVIGGVATFTGLSINLAADGYTLSATDGGLTPATSNSFNITPAAAAMLAFDQQPMTAVAGQSVGTVTVDVEDQYGNLVTNDSSSVRVSSTTTINGTTSVSAIGGVATFTGLSINLAAVGYTLSASDGGLTSATSNSFDITPAAASQLAFDQQPASAPAGQSIGTVTVDVEDQYGNLVTGDTSSVSVSSTTTINGTTSVSAIGGVATFTGLSINLAADGYTLSATDGALTAATSNAFDIIPAAAAMLVLDQQPSSASAGQSIGTVTVDVEDQYGNLVTNDTSSVSVSSSTAINGTTSVSAVGGVATFTGLSIDLVADNYTLSATDGGLTSATSSSFNITPAAAAMLVFDQQPASAIAGQTIGTVIVDVEDQYGNLVTGDMSTVSVSSSTAIDGTTSVSAVGGVATFTGLSIDRAADGYTLSATEGGLTSATSGSFSITPAAAAQLVFDQQPTDTTAGQTIGTATVDVEDVYGNLVTTDTSTVTLSSSATINGTTAVSAVGGVATFTGLSIDQAAAGYTLSAADTGLTSATSNPFNITPAAAAQLVFDQQPASATAGQSIGTVAVIVEDAYGNLVTTDDSLVTLSTSATINGTASKSAVGGVATFTGLSIDQAADGYALSAADTGLTSAVSDSFNVTPAVAARLAFVQQPASATAGQSIGTVIVDVKDDYGNIVTSDNSSVTVSSSTTINGTTSESAIGGVATFTGLSIDLAAGYTLSATAGSLTSASSNSFTITPAAASRLAFDQQPAGADVGDTLAAITVDVEDTYGNRVATNTSTVTLSTSTTIDGTTSVSAIGGVATFSGLSIEVPGGYALLATDGSLTSAASNTFTITPPTQVVIAAQPASVSAGTSQWLAVNLETAAGRVDMTDTSPVTLSIASGPSGATLGGTLTVAAVDGIASFSGLTFDIAGTYTLTASANGLTSATTASITVDPAAADRLVIAQQPPASATAGQAIGTVLVEIEDAYGNVVVDDDSNVTIIAMQTGSIASGSVGAQATTVAARGGVAVFSDLAITAGGTYVLDASDAALTGAASTPIIVATVAGTPVAPLMIKSSTTFPLSALNSKRVTIRVESDSFNGQTVLKKTVPVRNGQAMVNNLNLHKAGVYNVVVSNAAGNTMSEQITIVASAPAKLEFVAPVKSVEGRYPISVRVIDRYGNLTTASDGATVTLHLAPNPELGVDPTLTGTLTATIVDGVAAFTDVSIDHNGLGRLLATSAHLRTALSTVFDNTGVSARRPRR